MGNQQYRKAKWTESPIKKSAVYEHHSLRNDITAFVDESQDGDRWFCMVTINGYMHYNTAKTKGAAKAWGSRVINEHFARVGARA